MRLKVMFSFMIVLIVVATMGIVAQEEDAQQDIVGTLQSLSLANYLPDLDGRVIRVGLGNEYYPFNGVNSDGVGEGWDYDTLKEICDRLNCEIRYVEIAWVDLLPSVSVGERVDVGANGITRTRERFALVDFSMPYVRLSQVLIVRTNDERFSTLAQFVASDARIMTFENSTNYSAAVALVGEARVDASDTSTNTLINQLIAGEVDAIVLDDVTASPYLRANFDAIQRFPESITDVEELAFAFPNNSELVPIFNIALEMMRLDGTLGQLNQKWFAGE